MPVAIQSWANDASNRFQGGSFVGVFVMGGISALVVGPCVAAPLAGALVYISQTHDVIIGGLALFSMAMGMSVPLLLVGVSAGSLLPRAGAWMERVKQVFGLMLLGVAIWIVSPVLAPAAHLLLWALWLLVVATVLGWFGSSHGAHPTTPAWARASGATCLALAGTLLVGAASGGQSVLQPLSHLAGPGAPQSGDTCGTPNNTHLPFERMRTAAELDAHLRQAQAAGQPVMLDFYADWCVACKEYEAFTFSDTRVRQALARARLLQVDVTANTPDDKALLKRFGLFGPPGIALYAAGHLTPSATVIGYRKADDFLSDLAPLASNP
jgi:thiol:disulfide interchange protein DsbD